MSDAAGASDSQTPTDDPTIVAVGTSVMWSTGNTYDNKFPNLVHRDLTGDYPIDEKYLHYKQGPTKPGDSSDPTPSYYRKTDRDYGSQNHPRGDPIPPKQYRARGGAIIGLNKPAPVLFGDETLSDRMSTDEDAAGGGNNYLAKNADGSYYGKLDYVNFRDYDYSDAFDPDRINESKWLIARDIGWAWPTIPDQIDQFDRDSTSTVDVPNGDISLFGGQPDDQAPPGNDVDVVLLDGGTNDLTLGWLNHPKKAGRNTIWKACRQYMYRDMRHLIDRARGKFPNAVIVVLGYPVWASNRTNRSRAKKLLIQKSDLARLPEMVEMAVDNVLNFARFQAYWLRRAVAEKSIDDDGPGIVIAPPGYGVVNGMMADWPWAFGYEPDANGYEDPGITDDDVRDVRYEVCRGEHDAENPCVGSICPGYDPRKEVDKWSCYNAPIGHPNKEGCRQYADTIVRRYKRHVDRSVRETTEELDGRTDSVRESVERFGIGPDGATLRNGLVSDDVGLDWALSNRVVDSISVRLETDDPYGSVAPGAKEGRPYLEVYPGRDGTGERFALDTEYRDYGPGSTDSFYVEPMLRRRITGPVGNVDGLETGANVGMGEPNDQTKHDVGHWSDRRLKLGDVEHMVLVLDSVDPDDGWALEEATYEINGAIEGTRELDDDFLQKDFRARARATRFQIASFNHVDGFGKGDYLLGVDATGFDGAVGTYADVEATVTVGNTSDQRVPGVMIQYGLRINGNGRDWQVEYIGDLGPDEVKERDVTLKALHDPAFHTGSFEIKAGVFFGDTSSWISTTTSRSDL